MLSCVLILHFFCCVLLLMKHYQSDVPESQNPVMCTLKSAAKCYCFCIVGHLTCNIILELTTNLYNILLILLQPFNGLFSRTTWVSRYEKGKTNPDFTGARDSEWQWHQLGHMQVCTSLQPDNHASTPPLCFFTGRMPFLSPNQQCQSTEG